MKNNILLSVAALLLLSTSSFGQQDQTKVPVPQPDYSRYGSYSRRLQVYENVQGRLDHLDRERYRRFREVVRRDRLVQDNYVVVRRRSVYVYGDALRTWQRHND